MIKEKIKNFLVSQETAIVDTLQKIDENGKGIVFVLDEKERLIGAVTDGDIRRWLIKTGELSAKIYHLMNLNPITAYRKDKVNAQEVMDKYKITALPILSTTGTVLDIVFLEKDERKRKRVHHNCLKDVSVVIMAGGKGTRLYPYTKVLPKPLIPIGDIPIMERIIDKFCEYGVADFYATLNYRKSMIKSYFAEISKSYQIQYVEEDKPLGTGGSLHLIEKKFKKPIIVTNCDILINEDYEDIYHYHQSTENVMTIVSALKNVIVPYGVINSKENGGIISMDEKPKLSYFVNTGMYIINPELIEEIPQNSFYHMTDLANDLLEKGQQVGMYPISEDSFLDMGEFEEMHRMEAKLNLKVDER
ncbi:nucleotidyltransferase family protein [Anaerosacchariphilus polymeriproducens]|uniref:CBS domain-containing protein n=1 Tax=Anaerosacchariphilus polymeriproducens TaxID=1812858 RepID=A0A371AR05_9FIRM|nr:nucleotidyltransferase family protein [Anaerosacchariphilus polymeriproducens]RDU21870.1 CBS domain-containing protein [Anaerosacchariphilus polymeriproducens]